MKVCKTILVVWVSTPHPSAVLIVFCLLALFVWEFFCCWSSSGGHGFFHLVVSFFGLLCVFVYVLWPLFFIGADGVSTDPSIVMVSYKVVVMVTNFVNPLSLIRSLGATLGFVVFST